ARDVVVEGVAGERHCRGGGSVGSFQVLDIGARNHVQRVVDGGPHRVSAARVDNVVGGRVDKVGIVAEAAIHLIAACAAIEGIIAALAEKTIDASVAVDGVVAQTAEQVVAARATCNGVVGYCGVEDKVGSRHIRKLGILQRQH